MTPAERARETAALIVKEVCGSMDANCHVEVDAFRMTNAIAAALEQERREAIEACAKVVEQFVHTRRDCEAGTTTQEIAEDIRALAQRGKDE